MSIFSFKKKCFISIVNFFFNLISGNLEGKNCGIKNLKI